MSIMTLGREALVGTAGAPDEGQMAHTFIGIIRVPDSEENIRAYIKIYPPFLAHQSNPQSPIANRSLENEVIGYTLAKAKGLRVAPRAGIIYLDYDQIPKPPSWLQPGTTTPAWFSEDAQYPSLANFLKLSELDPDRKLSKVKDSLKRSPRKAAAWAAFDETTFNTDRNPGNVLTNDALIDHGSILSSELWNNQQLEHLKDETNGKNKILFFLQEHADELPFKQARVAEAETQASAYSDNRTSVHSFIKDKLYKEQPETGQAVLDFIEHRISSANTAEKVGLVA